MPKKKPDACPLQSKFCGCGRGASAIGDPPRREGMPSYSYRRMLMLRLEDANRAWREKHSEAVVGSEKPPRVQLMPRVKECDAPQE